MRLGKGDLPTIRACHLEKRSLRKRHRENKARKDLNPTHNVGVIRFATGNNLYYFDLSSGNYSGTPKYVVALPQPSQNSCMAVTTNHYGGDTCVANGNTVTCFSRDGQVNWGPVNLNSPIANPESAMVLSRDGVLYIAETDGGVEAIQTEITGPACPGDKIWNQPWSPGPPITDLALANFGTLFAVARGGLNVAGSVYGLTDP